jgi:hypothetical protein
MFEINIERLGGSWFSVTHPHDQTSKENKFKEKDNNSG